MHICFNALDYPSKTGGGGIGNQVQVVGRALVEGGHRITVIALARKDEPDSSEDQGIRVHRVRCGNVHWYLSKLPLLGPLLTLPVRELERSWAAYRRIAAIHKVEPIDLIEGTETGMFWVGGGLPGVPFLVRLHGEPYTFWKYTPGRELSLGLRLSRVLQRRALRRARLLVSPSRAHALEIRRELGRNLPRLEVIPNVLGAEGDAEGAVPPPGGPQGPEMLRGPVILYVGRLEHGKGVLPFLEAAGRVLRAAPDAQCVLAGAPHPTLPPVELAGASSGVSDKGRLHLLGHVPRRDLARWYRRASVCVLPSYYETFGLAALEALAAGVPVVAARAGGLPELVEEGVSGLLVPPGDADALTRAILRVLNSPELSRRLAEGGRRASARYRIANRLGENTAMFRRVAAGPDTTGGCSR